MSEERTQGAQANNGDWQKAQVSIVSSVTETKTHDIVVSEVLQGIRDGRWSKPVSRVRDKHANAYNEAIVEGNPDPAACAKKTVGPLKKKLPAVTFSGRFKQRANGSLLTHSGILCIDIDHHSDCEALREKLKGDPHVLAVFISPTGAGLKVLMRILPDSGAHDLSFLAAKKYFMTRYALDIDNCPDLARLCFVSHDPEIFIRSGNAEILEPEEPEPAAPPLQRDDEAKPGNEDQRTGENEQTIPGGLMFLPGGLVGNLRSAESIFRIIARRDPPTMFVRGGCVVRINENPEKAPTNPSDDGKVRIDDVSIAGFRSQVESYGPLFAYRAGPHGESLLKANARMSADTATMLLASDPRLLLPRLSLIHQCPLFVDEGPAGLRVLKPGYHRILGGRYIMGAGDVSKMPLNAAVELLLSLFEEFHFATPADKGRAIAAVLSPAMKMGELLSCHFPVFAFEADKQQAGKGYLLELIHKIYNEIPYMIGNRKGGVGGFDEELSKALLAGRPFICIDNVRDVLDSQFLEMTLTCEIGGSIPARVPYRQSLEVNPTRFIFQLTSNRFDATPDLAARSCIVRILKREGVAFREFQEGDLLEHVCANRKYYQSAIFTVLARWIAEKKPRTNDTHGEGRFRRWAQSLDWIVQKIFGLPPLLDGHQQVQRRMATPALSWLRSLGLYAKEHAFLNEELSASRLVEISDGAGLKIPGLRDEADDARKAMRVGVIMAELFKESERIQVETFAVERVVRSEYQSERKANCEVKFYVFTEPGP